MKSGFGGYKNNSSSTAGFRLAVDSFTGLYSAVLNIAGPNLLFFGIPETTTLTSGKVSKWTSVSNYLTSSSPLYLDMTFANSRPSPVYNTSAPYTVIRNLVSTVLTTKAAGAGGTYGNVDMTTVTNKSICAFMKFNTADNTSQIFYETGPGNNGGAYIATIGGLEIAATTNVGGTTLAFDVKRGHGPGQYQAAGYTVTNTNNYLRTSFNHYIFYYKAGKDDTSGTTLAATLNKTALSKTTFYASPADPSLATDVPNFNNVPIHWGGSLYFAPTAFDYSSLIIIGRKLTTDEQEKIYNLQRAIGDILA